VAGLTKTWSGDLTQEIAGRILSAINNYEEEEKLKEASPKVKQAARNLRTEDPDAVKVQSKSSAIVVKDAIIPVHVKVEQLDKEVKKISGKVTAIGTGLADTNKLIGDQNAMLEAKFDIMLGLLRARGAGEEEIKDGVTGGGGTSGSGDIVPVAFNKGSGGGRSPLGFLAKHFAGKIIRKTAKFLRRRIIPRRLRAGARLLRMKGKRFLRPITRQLSKVRPKNLMRKAAQRFATSGIGRKLTSKLGVKAATKVGSKTAAKSVAKKIPILGAVLGTGFAIQRLMNKEYGAAGLEFASGIASIFPGIGTGVSVGLDVALAAHDINKEMQPKTPVVPEREIGSGTDVMGMFKQASSLLLSSMIPIAASAGTLPEVKGQIKAAGLDGVEIARMQPPTGINIGRGGKKVSLPSVEPTVAKIPPVVLPKLPGVGGGGDKNWFQKGLDFTKEKIGGAWDWTKEKAGQAWDWIKEGTNANVEKVKAFVSNGAEAINNSGAANWVRDKIGSEKGDGFIGPKWMNLRNPFAKKEENNVKSETPAVPSFNKGAEGLSHLSPEARAWLGAINAVEAGGPDKFNRLVGTEVVPELTQMTIQEVYAMAYGREIGKGNLPARFGGREVTYGASSHAAGAYQFHPDTMLSAAQHGNISKDTLFTPTTQHLLALAWAQKLGIDTDKPMDPASLAIAGSIGGWEGLSVPKGKITVPEALELYNQMLQRETNTPGSAIPQGNLQSSLSPSTDVAMKSHQVQESSSVVDEIEDQEPPQPIVYLTNNNIATSPVVIIKKSSNMNDFVQQYRFMSLGAA